MEGSQGLIPDTTGRCSGSRVDEAPSSHRPDHRAPMPELLISHTRSGHSSSWDKAGSRQFITYLYNPVRSGAFTVPVVVAARAAI
jgi:hypothetical protein